MATGKQRSAYYQCNACGAHASKWAGQCGECQAWNTLIETLPPATPTKRGGFAGRPDGQVLALKDIAAAHTPRRATGIGELDRALGGGLVPGAVILIGGDPGIGKSTLLIQALAALAAQEPTLYVTGEESAEQIALRAQRLQLPVDDLRVLCETSVEQVLAQLEATRPRAVVIDSVQTLYTPLLGSAPGSVAQVRESAGELTRYAKRTGTVLFLVGHVTKEGMLAGPRVLEHMVDTVLYFEGDQNGRYRVLRAVKNRYGAANEIGVFAMTEQGLKEVSNPSAIFLSRHAEPVAGSIVMVTREGSRPLLVEVQALVDDAHGSAPRRLAVGLEQNRLALLLAVLHRHGGLPMYAQDVYVNVVGGVRVTETAADLPVLLAAHSSFRDRPAPADLIVFGEVGLAGEIRPVPNGQERLAEAAKHGFRQAIVPQANLPKRAPAGIHLIGVTRLAEAIAAL